MTDRVPPLREAGGEVAVRLTVAGDVGIAGEARARAERDGYDAALAGLAAALAGGDAGFVNLELPIGEPAEVRPGRSEGLRNGPEVPAALARAGVRLVSLANNHMLDCGAEGLDRTLRLCADAGLATAGAGCDLDAARTPARAVVRGTRVALLAYAAGERDAARDRTPGVAPLDLAMIRVDVARWRETCDVLLVSVHWGSMYVDYPPPRVTELAEAIAGLPVDAVIGHHPHVLQGVRWYGRVPVVFSLGDVAFNPRAGDFEAQVSPQRRRESGAFTLELGAGPPGLGFTPLWLDADGLPTVPDDATRARVMERVRVLSAGLEHGARGFAEHSAPTLLRYEIQSLGAYLRQGRLDKAARLLGSLRPRHLPLLWQALRRLGRPA